MGLVNSNRSRKIDRGHDIGPEHTFSLEEKKEEKGVTFITTVRVDNHEKNKLEAIATLGLSLSQRDSLKTAVDYYLTSLSEDQKRKFQAILEALEERDALTKNKKH